MTSSVTLYVPDSHGAHIDIPARDAFLKDVKKLAPKKIVFLGDHVDCGGIFSTHARSYTNEITESYEDDCAATNDFFDLLAKAAPKAEGYYLEGNHEARVERWVSSSFASKKDADLILDRLGPEKMLDLKGRGIRYFKRSVQYMGLSIPGAIRMGKCFVIHGISASKNATAVHVERFGDNIVHGHTHRSASVIMRNVTKSSYGGWCPGTLAQLQPLYMHTAPTSWTHGYGIQIVGSDGKFMHINVPIANGLSLLQDAMKVFRP